MQKSVRLKSFELIAHDISNVDKSLLHGLSMGVRWPHRPNDWDILLKTGQGLVAVDGIGRVFGSAMWFPYGDDFATIGMVITSPRTQAQGTGRWLMKQVLERCKGRNLSLNATQAAYSLYLSLGFIDEATVYQHQGEVCHELPAIPRPKGELVALPAAELEKISELDCKAFGTNRMHLLQLISDTAEIYGLKRNDQIVGYSFCREFGRGKVLGPIVASNSEDAIQLTSVHLQKLRGKFARVDTREKDGTFADFIEQCRLSVFGTVTTMSKGKLFLHREANKPWIYGLSAHGWG
ncbi:acetyltransferase family protein (plasmid) [Ochrobactrum quorumnocens]|uniref:Acetyltransferase family protein n=1 Tax=Ochrobactrum quorumnocens TaxID=271865 RepID=A0A248UNM4_9HYPH|nr:GNAT family N-acetyltransferase [[Ochrobactrum] quorumnocens]ASV88226.1 acetyltransferase family protein [[Ochrobactrum] quorumnocens]